MSFIIGTILALVFLEGWARVAVIAAVAGIEIAEIFIWLRWRKEKASTGPESMVGLTARALTDLSPTGQVQLKGQIWKATAREGAAAGDDVVVQGVEGLELRVAPRFAEHPPG